jgi:hypothetical protein
MIGCPSPVMPLSDYLRVHRLKQPCGLVSGSLPIVRLPVIAFKHPSREHFGCCPFCLNLLI